MAQVIAMHSANTVSKTVQYWRHPTKFEIKFGEGTIHYADVPIEKVCKPDGKLKKWFYGEDGLRYSR